VGSHHTDELEPREIDEAEGAVEDVVEIVGDAAREDADGLELLRVPDLVLHLQLFGDIPKTPDPADGFAVDSLRLGISLEYASILDERIIQFTKFVEII